MHRFLITLVVALSWVGPLSESSVAATPDETDQAGSLVDRGLTFAKNGQFRKAAELFEQAVKLNPDPTILHSLARAREEMGSHALAFETFRQALELDPQYIYAQDARDRMAFLERLLKSSHARIRVTSIPSGADVRAVHTASATEDRRLITPFTYWAPVGELAFEGRKDGFVNASRSITVLAGTERSVELVLRPVAKKGFLVVNISMAGARVFVDQNEVGLSPLDPIAIEAGPHGVRIEAEGYDPILREVLVVADKESLVLIDFNDPSAGGPAAPPSPLGAVLVGSGAMSLVGGIVMHLSAVSLSQDAREQSDKAEAHDAANQETDAARAEAEYFRLADESSKNETIAYIGYGVSAALIGLGAYMLKSPSSPTNTTSMNSHDRERALSWTPLLVPSPDGLYAGTLVRF